MRSIPLSASPAKLARGRRDVLEDAPRDVTHRAKLAAVEQRRLDAVPGCAEAGLRDRLGALGRERVIGQVSRERLNQGGDRRRVDDRDWASSSRSSIVPSRGCSRTSHQT